MPAESRHVLLVALEVTDEEKYARYRTEMLPFLARYGGGFGFDFEVSKVLKSESGHRINRVFSVSFPDREACDRFFADPDYTAVRAAWFEPSVASTTILGKLTQED